MRPLRIFSLLVLLVLFSVSRVWAETGSFERTFQVSGSLSLEVSSGSGSITVRTGSNGSVRVSGKIQAHYSWLCLSGTGAEEEIRQLESNPPIEQEGNRITIGRTENWSMGCNSVSIDYDLIVPAATGIVSRTGSGEQSIEGLRLPSSVQTGSGNVTVRNMGGDVHLSSGSGDLNVTSVQGALYAQTGSGNVRATSISRDVTARTGSGEVQIDQSGAGDTTVRTGSGGVHLNGIRGGLNVQTGSGIIEIQGEPTAKWRVGTGSGNIELRLPPQLSFNFEAETGSGGVRVDRQFTSQGRLSRHHWEGRMGKGGVLLEAHAGSGNIQID